MNKTRPALSVVIPSYNRSQSLLRTLVALRAQTLSPLEFEVIVSLDANSDGSAEAVRAGDWPFAVKVTAPQTRGAAAARNAGAAIAEAPRLVFLDDDIFACPEFLGAHLDAAEANRVVVGQSSPAITRKDWFSARLRIWWQDRFHNLGRDGHRFGYTDVMSGNLSLDKALFDRVGGFDNGLKCREDYELGYRLMRAGAKLLYAPDACGLHHDQSDMQRNLARAGAEGAADVRIARKHPELFSFKMMASLGTPYVPARVLRFVVFRAPAFGRLCQKILIAAIPVLEQTGLRSLWNKSNHAVWAYSYYTSAARELGTIAALKEAAARAATRTSAAILEIDLLDGIDKVLQRVAAKTPAGSTISIGEWEIAEIRPQPGSEPITARHLAALLRQRLDAWAPFATAGAGLPELPSSDPKCIDAVTREGDGYSLGVVDLSAWELTSRTGTLNYPMRLLIRRGPMPLGWIPFNEPPPPGMFWRQLRRQILNDAGISLRLLREQMLPQPAQAASAPPISLIICTRDRTDNLRRCLEAVRAMDYPEFEIIVVDNAPTSDATRVLAASLPGVRYVRENRPGLDWARNRGIQEARHEIVAFTDDDTQPDRFWLRGIAAAFSENSISAVTGLVLPMKLDTAAQVYFEDVYGGMGKGFEPWSRDRETLPDDELLWASAFGVGANMAFRRQVFTKLGLFDPALDVGTASRGGGDIEMFHRLLSSGERLSYAPEAIIWHEHRRDEMALARQFRDNGTGFACYLLTAARNGTLPRRTIFYFALRHWILGWLIARLIRPGRHRRSFVMAEIMCMFGGYRAYRKAQAVAIGTKPLETNFRRLDGDCRETD